MADRQLVKMDARGEVVALLITAEQRELIRRTVAAGCSDNELALFLHQAQRTGLDPLSRQIYAIKRQGKMAIQTSIDGFRLIAERTGRYTGQGAAQWCGKDGKWRDVWLEKEPPAAARVEVYRADWQRPSVAVARYTSYFPGNSPTWAKMPDVMLAKCAEALALRKAFPQELSGVYTGDEMEQADAPAPESRNVTPAPATPRQLEAPADDPAAKAKRLGVAIFAVGKQLQGEARSEVLALYNDAVAGGSDVGALEIVLETAKRRLGAQPKDPHKTDAEAVQAYAEADEAELTRQANEAWDAAATDDAS